MIQQELRKRGLANPSVLKSRLTCPTRRELPDGIAGLLPDDVYVIDGPLSFQDLDAL